MRDWGQGGESYFKQVYTENHIIQGGLSYLKILLPQKCLILLKNCESQVGRYQISSWIKDKLCSAEISDKAKHKYWAQFGNEIEKHGIMKRFLLQSQVLRIEIHMQNLTDRILKPQSTLEKIQSNNLIEKISKVRLGELR